LAPSAVDGREASDRPHGTVIDVLVRVVRADGSVQVARLPLLAETAYLLCRGFSIDRLADRRADVKSRRSV
jgi:hypothetical protein